MSSPHYSLYRQLIVMFSVVLVTTALLLTVRYVLVEPDEVAIACAGQATGFSCTIRNVAVYGFAHHLFGPVSVVAAILAWISALRLFAAIAMIAGICGMVLYDFDVAGFGMLLGAVLYIRLSLQRRAVLNAAEAGQ